MSDTGLPLSVLTEIGSPIRESRLTGVDELARLAWGADLALAASARHALQQMTEDDSRSVSAAAVAALERTAVRLDPERIDFGTVAAETQRLVAEVRVDGPPLAVAGATVTVSGPGLRAMLSDRTLRIMWLPRSDWLDGSVTVRGPAGWADVRVTGQVGTAGAPFAPAGGSAYGTSGSAYGTSRGAEPEGLRTYDGGMVANGYGPSRVTVLPAPPSPGRRQIGTTVLVAILTTLVVLGGAGVAMALLSDGRSEPPPVVALPTQPQPQPAEAFESAEPASPAPEVTRVPLAQRVKSVAKPRVIGTIRVGAEPEGVAVAPDGRTIYVANQNSRILSVVDAATRKVTPVVLRNTPRFVAVSRDGNTVFVSMYEDDKHTGSGVAVVDTRSRKVLRYLDTGHMPYTLAVAPDNKLWVPIHSDGRLEIFSSGTLRMVSELPVKPNPHAVGFSSDQMRAFTANHESNAVTVIDMRTNGVLRSIPVSRAPHSIAVSPDGRMALVAGYEADAANLIDTVTLKRTGPFKVGRDPQSVAFSADSRYGYTVNEGDGTISVLNGRTGAVTATVKVGKSPRTIGVSPDGRLAYVSNGGDNTISILRVGE
ncbi:YncE family protein [Paractinoplanes hotanensis]|uniref:Beta-propeller fold lactonase family protein n=1 Tax=Paractinoplanes hotanensis TaxID=2906497 RepID=A0ABT0Y3X0_9ACTN|nr:YncE family protein [Actinoplanes hotanensis]MCM4080725.1 beta-propeller fold lactonase family protein [Actinoplanes hotanensis]